MKTLRPKHFMEMNSGTMQHAVGHQICFSVDVGNPSSDLPRPQLFPCSPSRSVTRGFVSKPNHDSTLRNRPQWLPTPHVIKPSSFTLPTSFPRNWSVHCKEKLPHCLPLCALAMARGTHHEVPHIQASACVLLSPRDALPTLFFSWKISPCLENLAQPSLLSGIFHLVSKTVHHFLPWHPHLFCDLSACLLLS